MHTKSACFPSVSWNPSFKTSVDYRFSVANTFSVHSTSGDVPECRDNAISRKEEDNSSMNPPEDYVTSESVLPISQCPSARAKSGKPVTAPLSTPTSKCVYFPSVSGNPSVNASVGYRFSAANIFPVPSTSCNVPRCHNYAIFSRVFPIRETPIFLCYSVLEYPLCNGLFQCALRS